jgi:hypothetical protein
MVELNSYPIKYRRMKLNKKNLKKLTRVNPGLHNKLVTPVIRSESTQVILSNP